MKELVYHKLNYNRSSNKNNFKIEQGTISHNFVSNKSLHIPFLNVSNILGVT